MRCNDTRELISAYIDGELDLVSSLDLEAHLRECSICSREYKNQRAFHLAMRSAELWFEAPSDLERRIRTSLGRKNKSDAKPFLLSLIYKEESLWNQNRISGKAWRWATAWASVAAMVILSLSIGLMLNGRRVDLVAQDLVSSHKRSLMPGHTIDVPSSDQHTVKPWFNGKVDFSPPVKDLSDVGFNLIGGRLDYVANRTVAALVYTRGQHTINLYIWPTNKEAYASEEGTERQGYNMVHWTKDGMTLWAVSDLNPAELRDFVKAQRSDA